MVLKLIENLIIRNKVKIILICLSLNLNLDIIEIT